MIWIRAPHSQRPQHYARVWKQPNALAPQYRSRSCASSHRQLWAQTARSARDALPRVWSRSHGCDVGRLEDENSSRARAAAAGCDVNDDRNLRRGNLLDDLPRRIDQPSGRIDLDQYSLIAAPLRLVDGPRDIFLCDGLNRVINDDLKDFGEGNRAENTNRDKAENDAEN